MQTTKSKTRMKPERIRALLALRKIRQAQIAKELNVHPSAISRVISGKSTSDRIRRRIAHKLGVDVSCIWPQSFSSASNSCLTEKMSDVNV